MEKYKVHGHLAQAAHFDDWRFCGRMRLSLVAGGDYTSHSKKIKKGARFGVFVVLFCGIELGAKGLEGS